jgi:hypothetical protein
MFDLSDHFPEPFRLLTRHMAAAPMTSVSANWPDIGVPSIPAIRFCGSSVLQL